MTVTIDGQGRRLGYDDWSSRPDADVVGWRVACDCVPAHAEVDESYVGQRAVWLSAEIWVRVHRTDEDLSAGRIYAPADGAWAVDDHDDVAELVRAQWRRHTGPDVASAAVREAWRAARAAADRLDAAVVAARASGTSWAEIARATSMAHQSAQERWGKFTDEIATAKASRAVLAPEVPIAGRLRDRLARPKLLDARETPPESHGWPRR